MKRKIHPECFLLRKVNPSKRLAKICLVARSDDTTKHETIFFTFGTSGVIVNINTYNIKLLFFTHIKVSLIRTEQNATLD